MMDDWDFEFEDVMGPGLFLLILVIIGCVCWYEYKYPCIRSEQYACQETRCTAHMPIIHTNGKTTWTSWVCIRHETFNTTCTRCLERQQ